MSCVLRAGGESFDVEAFLRASQFEPCLVFFRGEYKSERRSEIGRYTESGFHVAVSTAEFEDFAQQKRDSLEFLRVHEAELHRLTTFGGIEGVELDFAVYRHETFVESYYLPPELMERAGKLGIQIGISCYEAPAENQLPNHAMHTDSHPPESSM